MGATYRGFEAFRILRVESISSKSDSLIFARGRTSELFSIEFFFLYWL